MKSIIFHQNHSQKCLFKIVQKLQERRLTDMLHKKTAVQRDLRFCVSLYNSFYIFVVIYLFSFLNRAIASMILKLSIMTTSAFLVLNFRTISSNGSPAM